MDAVRMRLRTIFGLCLALFACCLAPARADTGSGSVASAVERERIQARAQRDAPQLRRALGASYLCLRLPPKGAYTVLAVRSVATRARAAALVHRFGVPGQVVVESQSRYSESARRLATAIAASKPHRFASVEVWWIGDFSGRLCPRVRISVTPHQVSRAAIDWAHSAVKRFGDDRVEIEYEVATEP